MHAALALVRRELGPDAAVLHTREVRGSRWLGLLPVLFLLNCLASPFIIGFIKGAGNAGTSPDELLLVMVVGSLLLAAVSGAILSLVFRPHR